MINTITLLDDTNDKHSVVGDKRKAAGYFKSSNKKHTISIHYQNFRGITKIQATLNTNPIESDWFTIYETNDTIAITGTKHTTVEGNYAFIRSIVDREQYISFLIAQIGSVKKIIMAY